MQIKVKNLTHIFDLKSISEFKALDNVSVQFNQGEFVAIIGETGSGKTTFIEHLNALLIPYSGEVIIDNFKIVRTKRKIKKIKEIRKKVGVVFQFPEYQLFEETVEKDIMFGPISLGTPKKEAKKLAKKYLELVGLDSKFLFKSPFSLSGGQKRRVALAGILSMEPDFLIFDEPTAGLDPEGEKRMYKIFKKLHKEGKTVIVITHDLDHVLEHTERTIIFQKGKIVANDSSKKLMYNQNILKKFNLQIPKIVDLTLDLKKRGINLGQVISIDDCIAKLLKIRGRKNV